MRERMRKERNRRMRKRIAWLLAGIVFLELLLPACPAFAAETETYLQCSIHPARFELLSAVIQNEVGLTSLPLETRRVDRKILKKLAEGSDSLHAPVEALKTLQGHVEKRDLKENGLLSAGTEKDCYRVLSFPGSRTASDPADYERALFVNQALLFDFNQAFSLYLEEHQIRKTAEPEDFLKAVIDFLGYTQRHAQKTVDSEGKSYLSMKAGGVTYRFCWRVEKGYLQKKPGLHSTKADRDAAYINWGMLCYEAFQNYALEGDEGVLSENVYSGAPNQLERVFTGVLSGLLSGIRSFFGLWSTDELLFLKGYRESGYVGGIFPKNWEPSVWAVFFLAEVFSALFLFVGFAENILKKAASTMNFSMRMAWMDQVRDLMITAILLSLLPFFLRLLISSSAALTDAVTALIPRDAAGEPMEIRDLVSGLSAGGKTLSGVIIQFLYFGIEVYFNFFYAVRALSVAVLVMISPVMISFLALGSRKQQTTLYWAKELFAHVLIQPLQAFLMVLILILPHSAHGFDNFIALYAMIPLTAVLRGLFFGPGGSWAEQTVQKARSRFTGALAGGVTAAAGTAVAGSARLRRGGSEVQEREYRSAEGGISLPTDLSGENGRTDPDRKETKTDRKAPGNDLAPAMARAAKFAGGVALSATGGAIGGSGWNHAAAAVMTGAGSRLAGGSFSPDFSKKVSSQSGQPDKTAFSGKPEAGTRAEGAAPMFFSEDPKEGYGEENFYSRSAGSTPRPDGLYAWQDTDLAHYGVFLEEEPDGLIRMDYTDPASLSPLEQNRLESLLSEGYSEDPNRIARLKEKGIREVSRFGETGGVSLLVEPETYGKTFGTVFEPQEGDAFGMALREPHLVIDLHEPAVPEKPERRESE